MITVGTGHWVQTSRVTTKMSHLEVWEVEERWVGLQEFDIERKWLVREKEGEGSGG